MEYILVMTLSGSTMTVIYLLAKYLLRDRISARLHYLVAKAAVLYYLIPLPFLKSWYKKIIGLVMPAEQAASVKVTLRWTNYVLHSEEKMYLNIYAKLQIVLITVWLVVASLLVIYQIWEYLHAIRWFVKHADRNMTASQRTVLESLKEEYRIKRNILVFQGDDGAPTMTFGIFRPIILCGRPLESREAELLLRHEMIHIKRWDILWKVLIQFVKFLHWWNLFMWALLIDFERVSEWACDETVMEGKSKKEVDEYLLLLIEEAHDSEKTEKSKKPRLRFRAGFGNNAKKKLKKRMENLMKRRKWNKVAAGVLVTVLAFANSMTVFAYRDGFQEELAEKASQEEIEFTLDNDTFLFVSDETCEEGMSEFELAEETEILYEYQFIDEAGNIYPITEPIQRGCSHDYVSGKATEHHSNSDGSCIVREFRAQRCSKCGYVIRGEQISYHEYTVCPH
ncbi:MAG: M56 family metallopeptidase [Lachnospiraceae bacterium]|nr:M56 family metallopeptidase [Lachnospiraceae bacterium]